MSKTSYQQGLEDAWDIARQVVTMSERELMEDYGLVSLYHAFNELSAQDVKQKIDKKE